MIKYEKINHDLLSDLTSVWITSTITIIYIYIYINHYQTIINHNIYIIYYYSPFTTITSNIYIYILLIAAINHSLIRLQIACTGRVDASPSTTLPLPLRPGISCRGGFFRSQAKKGDLMRIDNEKWWFSGIWPDFTRFNQIWPSTTVI